MQTLVKRLKPQDMKEALDKEENILPLIDICLEGLNPESWRAVWILRKMAKAYIPMIETRIDAILDFIPQGNKSEQRELLKLLELLEVNEAQESKLFDICISIWEDVGKIPSTRISAFYQLLNIAKQYPELKNELEFLTQEQYIEPLSPGIRKSVLKKWKAFQAVDAQLS